jgi:hypothetical protein
MVWAKTLPHRLDFGELSRAATVATFIDESANLAAGDNGEAGAAIQPRRCLELANAAEKLICGPCRTAGCSFILFRFRSISEPV